MVQASLCYGTDVSYVLYTHIVGKFTHFRHLVYDREGLMSSPECRESRLHVCLEKQFGLKFVMQMIITAFIATSSSTLQIYKTFASEIVSMLTRCI